VKIVCAWCGSTMQINCHCGAPLLPTNYVGSTFEHGTMVCFNGETALTYSRSAIEEMEKTYGICPTCKADSPEEREALIAIRRAKDRSIPDDHALAKILEEIERVNRHERETRRADRNHKKRGPTGVTRSATTHTPNDTGKKHGAQ
jgi:hypothetical protein